MTLTPELAVALLNFATHVGVDAAIAIGNAINKPQATLDDAINALKDIQAKSAEDYLKEAGGAATLPTPPAA